MILDVLRKLVASSADAVDAGNAVTRSEASSVQPVIPMPHRGVSHPVVDLIWRRAGEESQPEARRDEFRLGLAIEGGSMRGVVSAAMLAGLEQLGLLNVFDAVYGSSAGAINGAYFISGRAALCTTSYYNEMRGRGFVNWLRVFRGKPIVSLHYVLDVVAETSKPLDWDRVLRSPIELHPVATSLTTLEPVDLAGARSKEQLKEALRASSCMPLLAGPPVRVGDDWFVDATESVSLPFSIARDDNCSHVLVLRTRPQGVLRGKPNLIERLVVAPVLRRRFPDLAKLHLGRAVRYAAEVEEVTRLSEHPGNQPPYVLQIAPASSAGIVRQADRDRDRLVAGARAGVEAVYAAFTGRIPTVLEVLLAYDLEQA